MADGTWKDHMQEYFEQFLEFAAKNPKEFLVSFFIIITPLMMICGYLSYLMVKQIDEKERAKKKKAVKSNNKVKARRKATKAD